MSDSKVKIGLVGCGVISAAYLKNIAKFDNIEVVFCADIDLARAKSRAAEFNIPGNGSVEDLLAVPEIEIVLNLTIPAAHAGVALAALAAGKSVYNEKPLAVTREDGQKMLQMAEQKGLRVGDAPDTFLGAGLQTCRKLIDDGVIGTPVAATAFMLGRGPEAWHPDPEFFYQPGGGPLFDMGPYYITALINMLGPIRRVTSSAQASFPERTIGSGAKQGQKIPVNTPTHLAAILDFESGAVGTLVTSFDVWGSNVPRIEIYGSEGSISVPDPNTFGGPVLVRKAGEKEWTEAPLEFSQADESRGLGLSDMAAAIRANRPHRASGALAYHVLDTMHAVLDSSSQGKHIELTSGVPRPAALPLGLEEWHAPGE